MVSVKGLERLSGLSRIRRSCSASFGGERRSTEEPLSDHTLCGDRKQEARASRIDVSGPYNP